MVGLITAGLLGFLLYIGLDWLEKRLIPWAGSRS
jgi:ABC-type nitrate/sulfonate/bicarbonate transport system permease component